MRMISVKKGAENGLADGDTSKIKTREFCVGK